MNISTFLGQKPSRVLFSGESSPSAATPNSFLKRELPPLVETHSVDYYHQKLFRPFTLEDIQDKAAQQEVQRLLVEMTNALRPSWLRPWTSISAFNRHKKALESLFETQIPKDHPDWRYSQNRGISLSFDSQLFAHKNLKNIDLSHLTLRSHGGAPLNFSKSNLSFADLSGSCLTGANFYRATLTHANLWHAKLKQTDFSGAHLKHAALDLADLTEANLEGANLKKASLHLTCLTDARLANTPLDKTVGMTEGLTSRKAAKGGFKVQKANKPEGEDMVIAYSPKTIGLGLCEDHVLTPGQTYHASVFSRDKRSPNHPGLTVYPTLEAAQEYSKGKGVVELLVRPGEILQAGFNRFRALHAKVQGQPIAETPKTTGQEDPYAKLIADKLQSGAHHD